MSYKFYRHNPYKHQVRALKRVLELDKACALLMEPGTGKSRVAIDFCGIKAEAGQLQKVLIISPLTILSVWEDEIKKWLPKRIPRQVLKLDMSIKERIKKVKQLGEVNKLTFILINYDAISATRDVLKGWADLIVVDEGHYIKRHTSMRSKAIQYLGIFARWRLLLTGTPITNSPLDIYSQYKFLDPNIFGTRWNSFRYTFAMYGGFGGFKLLKFKNLKTLQNLIHKIAFRATKDELDLPEIYADQIIRVKPSEKTLKLYNQMSKDFLIEIEETKATASIILTKMLRLSQITGGFVRDESGEDIGIGTEKLDALKELLEMYVIEGDQKVVIFARFKWELRQIRELCERLDIECGVFTKKNGDKVKKRFLEDPSLKVFISQIARGGIGINELVVSHIGIFYSLDYSSDHLTQARDRLHRPGQTERVLYLFLLMSSTLDRDIYRGLKANKDLATSIVNKVKKKVIL